MPRPRSETPKEHTSIIRAKRKDGWTYVQRVVSVYDPKIKNSKRLSTEYLGKLPPGETDLEKLVPLEPRRRKARSRLTRSRHPLKKLRIQEIRVVSFIRLISSSVSFFLRLWKARLPAPRLLNSGDNAAPCRARPFQTFPMKKFLMTPSGASP